MSEYPQNPFYDAMRNWQRVATEMVTGWRARLEAIRGQWYGRFVGPAATPIPGLFLRRVRGSRTGARTSRSSRTSTGRVIPHASRPGYEPYDFTYRKGASRTPPFTTHKRLGLEGEPYDFTY